MIASLPMYDLPELRDATDTLWQAVARAFAREGLDAPDRLTRGGDAYAVWESADLLLAQTCGYPLTHRLTGRVRLVAVPCYAAPGCDGPHYCGVILVRREAATTLAEMRGARAAYNSRDSQSGYAAFRAAVAPYATNGTFFGEVMATGAHAASIAMVRDGRADICCVDAVLHALLVRHRPAAVSGLVEIGRTPSCPGLPLITSAGRTEEDVAAMRRALAAVARDAEIDDVRAALRIGGFAVLPANAYRVVLDMENECRSRSYPELA